MKKLFILVLLLLVAGGVYYWQHQKVTDIRAKVTDADKQIQIQRGQIAALQNEASKKTAAAVKSDNDLITEAVKNNCEATSGNTAAGIKVDKVASPYATASYTCGTAKTGNPAKKAYLKKMTDQWVVVFTTTGTTAATAKDLAPYGFPANFLQ